MRPDFMGEIAKRKVGSDEWRWFKCEAIGDDALIVTGAIPIGAYSRGKRAGRPKFPPMRECQRVVVTESEIEQHRVAYEREQGLCSTCGGAGNNYRPCRRCGSTGKAPTP